MQTADNANAPHVLVTMDGSRVMGRAVEDYTQRHVLLDLPCRTNLMHLYASCDAAEAALLGTPALPRCAPLEARPLSEVECRHDWHQPEHWLIDRCRVCGEERA